jgi:hypothetical protein
MEHVAELEVVESHDSGAAAIALSSPVLESRSTDALSSTVYPEASSDALEPLFPMPPGGGWREWERFSRYRTDLDAHIVAGLLENEGVATIIESVGVSVDATSPCILWVPKGLVHRVRWILAWPPPTDAELIFLATGELVAEDLSS